MEKNPRNLRRLRIGVTAVAVSVAVIHILFPRLAIDAITLGLLAIAVLPWLAPLVKSVELPGGLKVELQDVEKAAEQTREAGLSDRTRVGPQAEHTFQLVAQEDPNLALAGLRIEIERRLIRLAEARGVQIKAKGMGPLLRLLGDNEVITREQREALGSLMSLLNSAVHGAVVEPSAASEAMSLAPELLESLDRLIAPTGPKTFVQPDEPKFALDGDLWVN